MEKRRFSLEDDFMKTRANITLYGFMRCISTLNPQTKEEYLYKSDFDTEKVNVARKLCNSCTARTISNNIKKLIEEGLIKEESKNDRLCYSFPYDYDGIYKLIELPLLEYIVDTRNDFGIQIYLYLLNKSCYKDNYIFTIKELIEAFGYSEKSKMVVRAIKNNLESLRREGVIDYEESYQQIQNQSTGKIIPSPIKTLKFVAKTLAQIRSEK